MPRGIRRVRATVAGVCICVAALCAVTATSYAAAPTCDKASVQVDADDADRIETNVRDGFLFVTVQRPVAIRLYSILGQLISQQTLQPGTTRLRVPGRGVYILKAGTLTRRIII